MSHHSYLELPENESSTVNQHHYIFFGWLILLAGAGSFFLWATFAPLEKGVVAAGTVMVEGYRKVIQAPVSGVITLISAREGMQVQEGETLAILSQTPMLAQLNAIRLMYVTSILTKQRLEAERIGRDTITFPELPESLLPKEDLDRILQQQTMLMHARQSALKEDMDGLQQSIHGINQQVNYLIQSNRNKTKSMSWLAQQLKNLQPLMSEGYYPHNRYLDSEQQLSSLAADINETEGRIAQMKSQMEEINLRIRQHRAEYDKDVETQLDQIHLKISESRKQLSLMEFELAQTTIKAPHDGVILGLNLTTDGAVVSQGEQLMELVPQKATLIIDAHLDVNMRDQVHNDLPVTLMFTAFHHQRTPRIPGKVILVSADRQTDQITHKPYYKIQVAVTPEGMKMLSDEEVKPGMSAEVFIKTGERTLLSYLIRPIKDRLSRSFIEE